MQITIFNKSKSESRWMPETQWRHNDETAESAVHIACASITQYSMYLILPEN